MSTSLDALFSNHYTARVKHLPPDGQISLNLLESTNSTLPVSLQDLGLSPDAEGVMPSILISVNIKLLTWVYLKDKGQGKFMLTKHKCM